MTSNNLLFFRYIANNKMSTQQEIENPSTSHEISRFIKNSGYLQKEKKLPKYHLDLQIFTLKDTPRRKSIENYSSDFLREWCNNKFPHFSGRCGKYQKQGGEESIMQIG